MRKKRETIVTPFTRWLLEYADEHDTTLTELSLRAGLSAGTLRTYVTHPERQRPTVETTCIRLRSLGIARSSGQPKLISTVLSRLGILAWNEQDYRPAGDYFNKVLKFERKLDRKDQIARTMITLGDIARFEGELQIAERNYNKAIKMFSDLKNNDGIADCLISLSSISFQKGRYDRAWELLVRSLDIGDLKNDVYLSGQVIERVSDFVSIAKYEEEATELAKRISKSSSN